MENPPRPIKGTTSRCSIYREVERVNVPPQVFDYGKLTVIDRPVIPPKIFDHQTHVYDKFKLPRSIPSLTIQKTRC